MRKVNQSFAYCKDQDNWIRSNMRGRLNQGVAEMYFNVFGVRRSLAALKVRAYRLGVRPARRPLGVFVSEKRNKEGGVNILIGLNPQIWTDKARYLYENYHNEKLSSNDVIISLDGNRLNYDKGNLVKLTRSENLKLNSLRSRYSDFDVSALLLIAKIEVLSQNLSGKGDWSKSEIDWLESNLDIKMNNRLSVFNEMFNKKRSSRCLAMMRSVIRRRNEQ